MTTPILFAAICAGSILVVGLMTLADWLAEAPIRRAGRGRLTAAEFEVLDALWLIEHGISV